MDKLSEKYKIPNWQASNFLVRINTNQRKYYEYKDKKYLIANPYLILNSKAEELKYMLIECNNNETITRRSHASSLLANNGFPKDCHSALLKELGFHFIRKNERGEDDSSDPIIVHRTKYGFREFFNSLEYYPLVRQNFD
jgi:hypothetical protein